MTLPFPWLHLVAATPDSLLANARLAICELTTELRHIGISLKPERRSWFLCSRAPAVSVLAKPGSAILGHSCLFSFPKGDRSS